VVGIERIMMGSPGFSFVFSFGMVPFWANAALRNIGGHSAVL
jgi:hypothetical protein